MKNWMIVAAVLAPLAGPAAAGAAEDTGHWYLTPEIGRINTDDRRGVSPTDWIYGARVGKHLNDVFSAELGLSGAEAAGRTVDNLTLYGGSLNLLATANRGSLFAPYLLAGLGVVDNQQRGGPDRSEWMAEAGVGILTRLWGSADGAHSLSLRPEYKMRWNDSIGGTKKRDEIISVGLQFAFGAPDEAPVARAVSTEPAAPPPPPPPPPPAPPPDSDGDGVIDPQDACPGTPAGVAVDERGCPRIGAIVLEGIGFETNSNAVTADSRPVLDSVAADLKRYPSLRIELQGHTDSSGADAYNLRLSQQRANAVREYLLGAGVPSHQLVARGYGEAQPVASNATAEGRTTNRRVVMLVLENSGEVRVTTPETPQTRAP